MWFHGASNALAGHVRISYTGAENYAKPDYQESMGGGAYVLVPFANERRLEDGELVGSWGDEYIDPVKALFDTVYKEHAGNISKVIVFGQSRGAGFNWGYTFAYPESIDASVIISGSSVPTDEELDRINEAGVTLLVAHGIHDELAKFELCMQPHVEKLQSLYNTICYFPEWVRNSDGGVASINVGKEMGQHCIINQVQANLMYDDGTCYDDRFPEGITGWIRDL